MARLRERPQGTWAESREAIRARAVLTERARCWAMRRVGAHGETVASVARQLGVGWHTLMRAVRDYGQPLVDDPGRLDGVSGLGVDEHVWAHAGTRPSRHRSWAPSGWHRTAPAGRRARRRSCRSCPSRRSPLRGGRGTSSTR